jgi:hypothetical protein
MTVTKPMTKLHTKAYPLAIRLRIAAMTKTVTKPMTRVHTLAHPLAIKLSIAAEGDHLSVTVAVATRENRTVHRGRSLTSTCRA